MVGLAETPFEASYQRYSSYRQSGNVTTLTRSRRKVFLQTTSKTQRTLPPYYVAASPLCRSSFLPQLVLSIRRLRVSPAGCRRRGHARAVTPTAAFQEMVADEQGCEGLPEGQLSGELSPCEWRAWDLVKELQLLPEPRGRLALLLRWGQEWLPSPTPHNTRQGASPAAAASRTAAATTESAGGEVLRVKENRVMGCTAQVWARVDLREGHPGPAAVHLAIDSDAGVTRGLCAILFRLVEGASAEQVLEFPSSGPALQALGALLGPAVAGPARANGLQSMLLTVQKRVRQRLRELGWQGASVPGPDGWGLETLPSILISPDGSVSAQGSFAEAQAQYLSPDPAAVQELVQELRTKRIGVVAHFYMDPQVQGVLVAAQREWPHITISDSLVMADRALRMVAEGGCRAVAVLGVDFMAENVRAVLERGGVPPGVPVLRMSQGPISCSLAEAARSEAYTRYLEEASRTPASLHVIYINTALDTKAVAQHFLPTITCTSSNVLQTVLQAFAQVPEATLWFGPDTYMGGNLVEMLHQLSTLPDEEIRALHPGHTAASLRALLPRVRYFQDGACIVHDMFGSDVVGVLRAAYPDAYHTAHFEVPGEMFRMAMEARERGRGAVGSTQNILDFICERTREAVQRGHDERLQFVLGTESGMVTAIVNAVQRELMAGGAGATATPGGGPGREDGGSLSGGAPGGAAGRVEVEVIFPVNQEAVTDPHRHPGRPAGSNGSASHAHPVASNGGASGSSGAEAPALGLRLVPGPAGGEGCSLEGGCASCPYMKMNSLDALMEVCRLVGLPGTESSLAAYEPNKFAQSLQLLHASSAPPSAPHTSAAPAESVADLGYEPILHMRHFQKTGQLSEELVEDIRTRWKRLGLRAGWD